MNEQELRSLSTREREVLKLIAACYSNKGIARKLDRDVGTINSHIRRVKDKLRIDAHPEFSVRTILLRAGEALIEMERSDNNLWRDENVLPFTTAQ